jgi:hypothetical protein
MNTSLSTSKRIELADKAIVKRFKDGRGSGVGRDYQPFLTVRDVPSTGRVHRLPSATVGRVHHLLSDLEHHVFCQLDWHPETVDIREQFPIALEDSRALAERLGIAHPSFAGVDQVVTTDFIVDMNRAGRVFHKAISAKYAEDLDDPRVIEKLELERRYWSEKDIPFCIVTEQEIPKLLVQNIKWIRPFLTSYGFNADELKEYFGIFNDTKRFYPSQKISSITNKLDDDYNLEVGTHLSVLRPLLAQRAFSFDMLKKSVKTLIWEDLVPSEFWLAEQYEYVVSE